MLPFLYVKVLTIRGNSESQFNLAFSKLRFLHFKDGGRSVNFKISSTPSKQENTAITRRESSA